MLEANFALVYHLKLDMDSVIGMSPKEQEWYIKRLNRQYAMEEQHVKTKTKKTGASKLVS